MPAQLTASPIEAKTKGELKRLRKDGYVPVSIQHRGSETVHLQQEVRPLQEFIHEHGQAAMLELQVGSDRRTVMIHDVYRDPISRRLTQVVFQEVVAGEHVETPLPLLLPGLPESGAAR